VARYPRYTDAGFSIGPGPASPAVKFLIIVNIAAFLISNVLRESIVWFGFSPSIVIERFALWQFVTYMFIHGDLGHVLFNMLALWMFGTDLERTWRTRFFVKYYFVCGIGAAVTTLLWAISPLPGSAEMMRAVTVGASGAIYGLLLAYGIYFPHRVIYLIIFPIQARYFVMIAGAISFYLSTQGGGGVAHTAHLGGLVVGYLYLKGLRFRLLDELKYRWLRWKMNRARSKFDVYSGGRQGRHDDDDWKSDWKKHIH
jgi:membrane associated rhomboid family serine protease